MRTFMKCLLPALLLLPALSHADTLQTIANALPDTTSLMALLRSPWGITASVMLVLLGAAGGVCVGPPTPAMEGVALACYLTFMPDFATRFSPAVQSAALLFLPFWICTFVWVMVTYCIRNRRYYEGNFSFLEILLGWLQ